MIITIGNLLTEQTFKQIYQERKVYKPEFKKALKIINNSNHKYLINEPKHHGYNVGYWSGRSSSDLASSISFLLNDLMIKNFDSKGILM